jgi:hypothetical protein
MQSAREGGYLPVPMKGEATERRRGRRRWKGEGGQRAAEQGHLWSCAGAGGGGAMETECTSRLSRSPLPPPPTLPAPPPPQPKPQGAVLGNRG